jgi:predicted TIM-barrel fold metal-dependent hydrolase
MTIIDAHLHLDPTVDGTALGAARELDQQLANAGIARGLVLHLETQPWTARETAAAVASYPRLKAFINVHPYKDDAKSILSEGVTEMGYTGLKLHPRLQEFETDDIRTIELVQEAGRLNVPVLIDAFPDGTHLMQGFNALRYATLARECPETKIIWAHMGGHHVLDFMMLAKRLPNVYMDTSYSLLYYRGSAVIQNLVYAMRSMRFDRIFYGSDYPDRPIKDSLNLSIGLLRSEGLTQEEIEKILSGNVIKFFQWTGL